MYDSTKGLIKIGNTKLPLKYMKAETYKVTPNQTLDLDSGRDTTGVLHRTVLSHTATKIEFNTPYLHEADMRSLMSLLPLSTPERKATLEYYDTTSGTYKTGTFYMPDIDFTIYNINESTGDLFYEETRIAFIEY